MGDKAGKNFTMPQKKGVKSSLKSSSGKEGTLKGKDDSSAKSKKGRKVQFDAGVAEPKSNFSSKYGGKGDTPTAFPKGKGDRLFNSGKSSVPKTPQPLELRIEDELPKNVKCLLACEAAEILQGIQEHMVFLSKDPTIKTPVSFDRGLQYAKRGSHYTNALSIRKVLETLTQYGVTDGEICIIADVCPETADEVFALVPSLKANKSLLREPVKKVLLELAKLKQPTPNNKM
ncbi:DNA-directed RNA polymerases IV and V subunit 4 [Morus notabilis]|uniref:DNA-directed RNA polymerases IV and V subunit 4 n=1 Tax=Morus notabilis TaxID=981085 RepID=UPI000CED640A|nr:DNA-directed RNA polymerases IV and V subunit 4 [Morus notabilis]